MIPMNWDRVREIYHAALAIAPGERPAFLDDACAGDADLRREVESLLARASDASDFLETSALELAGRALAAQRTPSLLGTRLGEYEIRSFIGAGGMGEVYLAHDLTLERDVAIKCLPAYIASDQTARARLRREARLLATLNHPNIASIYGAEETDGVIGLVLELVEGPTLAERAGALSLREVVAIARQIAEALEAAHDKGIIHRDLKPANIKITSSGAVKVLDFGLAKALEDGNQPAEDLTGARTRDGVILGTPAYMSPEQARGKQVDRRTDVWAFGCVLYELIAGRAAFGDDNAGDSLVRVLESDPDWSALPSETPEPIRRVLRRCLEKLPEARYPSAYEVRDALNAEPASRSGGISRRAVLGGALIVVLVGAVGLGVRAYVRAQRILWVETTAAPAIARLIIEERRLAAASLYHTAERYAPASPALLPLTEGIVPVPISIITSPPGVRVYISDYYAAAGDDLSQWRWLGEAPLRVDDVPRWGHYRIRAVKEGFAPVELTHFSITGGQPVEIRLHAESETPPGMVWVPAMDALLPPRLGAGLTLPGFWMDRYEVTNAQFKLFVDAGGYQKEEYWTQPFVRDGRTLSWREGIDGFRDLTNRPGPAGWQLGTYPEGTEDMPVGGVSWYEAAAYAVFAGKNLPTLYEWYGAALGGRPADMMPFSNFTGPGLTKAGANRGMSRFGTYDMAGNVKEWVSNPIDDRRYLLGGAWSEEDYVFTIPDPRSPFERDTTFGFRCVRRTGTLSDDAFKSFRVPAVVWRGAAVDETTFQRFVDLHAYDKTDLEASVERVDDTSPYWRKETVTFRTAYDNDRVIAHLFLPKRSSPPYQLVAFMGGGTILGSVRRIEDLEYPYQFLVRAGRAVVIPAFSGTLERGPSPLILPRNQARDRDVRWSMDLGRSLDYLESRSDIDTRRVAFYGVSIGGTHGVRFVAVDRRFKTAILTSAGLFLNPPPETDAWNFAPHVDIPVLMMNGRHDFNVPYETSQWPLFDALATRDKEFRRYEGGHANLVTRPDLIGEILDWLDKYLGPVK